MKKLLNLLLLMVTTMTFAQNGQDFTLKSVRGNVSAAPISVGDTIFVRFQLTQDVSDIDYTLAQFDFEYNNKLLEKVSHEFNVGTTSNSGANPSAMTSLNEYNEYKWTPIAGINPSNLSNQYQQGSYSANADWSVGRITVQDGSPLLVGSIIDVRFKIKDIGNTNYTDYSEVVKLNWANLKDNSTNTTFSVWDESPQYIDLGEIAGGALGTITLKLNTTVTNKIDYGYRIEELDENNNFVNDGNNIDGDFDAAGEATISGLTDGANYRVWAYVQSEYNQETQSPTHPAWLDDVVTISDVYLVFNYMSSTDIDGNGTGTFDYYIQKQFADITQLESELPEPGQPWIANVNDNDSYVFLSFLAGTLPEPNDQTGEGWYPISSTKYGSMNYSMLLENYGKEGGYDSDPSLFTANYDLSLIEIAHGLNGDVDLSHSHTPATSGYTTSAKSVSLGKVRNTAFSKVPENSNLDITTQLVDGKVVLEISTTKTGMAGAQVNLNYDTSRLEFSEVIFDSGNTMTNFANEQDGKIFIGSLDLKGENTVKTGTPYKVIFTPKETLTNTAGLVSFGVTEGVKTDGTKVKFNIQ